MLQSATILIRSQTQCRRTSPESAYTDHDDLADRFSATRRVSFGPGLGLLLRFEGKLYGRATGGGGHSGGVPGVERTFDVPSLPGPLNT